MPKSKLSKEFQADDDGTVVVPKELLPEPTITVTALKKAVKRPMSDAQKANCERLIADNKKRWEALREAKEKQSKEALSAVKQEEEKLIEEGTHVRLKIREKAEKPRKVKEKIQEVPAIVDPPKSVKKPQQKKHSKRYTDTSDDETDDTETETETETESEDDMPPRRVARQARRQIRTLAKIDEVIQQSSNPYMSKLMGRWK